MSSVKKQYQALMIDHKRRQERNVRLLARLENIEKKAAFLQAKTDRIKSLKSIYKNQVNKPSEPSRNINIYSNNLSNRILTQRIPVDLAPNYNYNQHDPLQYSNYRYERIYTEPNPVYTLKPITLDDAIEEISRRFILVPKQVDHERNPAHTEAKTNLLNEKHNRNNIKYNPYEAHRRDRLNETFKRDQPNEAYTNIDEGDKIPLNRYESFETDERFEANTSEDSEEKANFDNIVTQKHNNDVSNRNFDLVNENLRTFATEDTIHDLSNEVDESKDDASEKEQITSPQACVKKTESPKLSLNLKLEKIKNAFVVSNDMTAPEKVKQIDIINNVKRDSHGSTTPLNNVSHEESELNKLDDPSIHRQETDYNEKDQVPFENDALLHKKYDNNLSMNRNDENEKYQNYIDENEQHIQSNTNEQIEHYSIEPEFTEDHREASAEQYYDETNLEHSNVMNQNNTEYANQELDVDKQQIENYSNQPLYNEDYTEQPDVQYDDKNFTEYTQNAIQLENDNNETENYAELHQNENQIASEHYAEVNQNENQVDGEYQHGSYAGESTIQYDDNIQNNTEYNQTQQVYSEDYNAQQDDQYKENTELQQNYNPQEQANNDEFNQNQEVYNENVVSEVNEEYINDTNQVQYDTNQDYYYGDNVNIDNTDQQYEQDPNYTDPNTVSQSNVYYNEGEIPQQIQYETENQDYINQDNSSANIPQYSEETEQQQYDQGIIINQTIANEENIGNPEYEQYDLSQPITENVGYSNEETIGETNMTQPYEQTGQLQYTQDEPAYDETYGQQENTQYDDTIVEDTPQNYNEETHATVKPLEILESDTDHDKSNIDESSKQESDFDFSLKQ